MAFEVTRLSVIDTQPSKAVGVALPFSGKAVFNSTYTSKDALKTNIINYFLTAKGERFMNPNFGNRLQNLLFDNLTQEKVSQIQSTVERDMEVLFPRVNIINLTTVGDPDTHTVQFAMSYTVQDTNIEDEVIINFEQ
jgi:phage baseplate assembly protein W